MTDPEYWDFDWEEIAQNDVPKVLETVFKISGTCIKAAWYGHSAGMNIILRAIASSDVKSSNYLRAVVGNAPGLLAPVNFYVDGFGLPNSPFP